MTENWDKFQNNIGETIEPIERKPFTFNYNRFEVWKDGVCIASGYSDGQIIAKLNGNILNVLIDDKSVNDHIKSQFSFGEISTTNDRMMWSKDIFNSSGIVERNNPDVSSLFFKNGNLTKVTFTIHDPNTLIEFYPQIDNSKSKSKSPSIDLSDFKFLSDDHTRYESGVPTNSYNKGAWRGIRVKSFDSLTFFVTMYIMTDSNPVWGDNIQMTEKIMKFLEEDNSKIVLQGFGMAPNGASYADYGLTLHKSNENVNKVTLHLLNRDINIVYENAVIDIPEKDVQLSDFEKFKIFDQNWKTTMTMADKIKIAVESDAINNRGTNAYRNDDYDEAIEFFEQALVVMPNNNDALFNLKLCYSEMGDFRRSKEMSKRLEYLEATKK